MLTPEQERVVVWLARQVRPFGAPRWDEAGIAKFVAKRRQLAFPEVLLDVIACALDPKAESPAVLGKLDWRTRLLNVAGSERPHVPEPAWDPTDRCAECSRPRHACEAIPEHVSGHRFRSVLAHTRDADNRRINVPATVRGCKTLAAEPAPEETP